MQSSHAPPLIEANRRMSASQSSASITRLKDPSAHTKRGVGAAVTMACIGIVLAIISTLATWESLDDCRMQQVERGTPEHSALHADDKHSQFVFVIIFHATYLGLILGILVELAGASKTLYNVLCVTAFWVVDAILAYIWRLIVYIYVVKPLGLAIEGTNCGTSKVISGHTHFYCFHVLLLGFLLFVDSRPFLATTFKKTALVSGDSGDPRFIAWLVKTSTRAYALFVIFWTFGTLQQTYFLGFHSLRHMLSGFSAACLSFAVFILPRARILDSTLPLYANLNEQKLHVD